MEKMVRQICDEIGLDVLEIEQGFDFEGTVSNYTDIAKELENKGKDISEIFHEIYNDLKKSYDLQSLRLKFLELCKEEVEKISKLILEGLEFENGKYFIQFEYTMNELIDEVEVELQKRKLMDEDIEIKELIENESEFEDLKENIFEMFCDEITTNTEFECQIDSFFWEIRVFE